MRIQHLSAIVLMIASFWPGLSSGLGKPSHPIPPLMPLPKSFSWDEERLVLDDTFKVRMIGQGNPILKKAMDRLLQRLRQKTGLLLDSSLPQTATETALEIYCRGQEEAPQTIMTDESYQLQISSSGARLQASSYVGIIRGLETFIQLVGIDGKSFYLPTGQILDEPRFRWRGLLIDVARHWQPMENIKRNLDAMSAVKMNVLHLHLSDDQAFRVESRRFPRLHEVGSDGHYYTQHQIREIIEYASDRGIRIVPEFDMPGHTTAWLAAYPELASAPGPYFIEHRWGVFDPCMDPTNSKVYAFLDSFVEEMAGLFPDEYFHIGGDEVTGKHWNTNRAIQAFKVREGLANNAALHAYFNQRVQKILNRHSKKMIGWDEILHANLPASVTVQSWRGHAYLAQSARQGHPTLLSYGFYLDHMRPASYHHENDPLSRDAAELTREEQSRILGGEACMWAEFVNADNIDSRIWPRAAAIADRLWAPQETRDRQDMYRRLNFLSAELEFLGLRHRNSRSQMLRRMAGFDRANILENFADLLRPAGIGVRVKARPYHSRVPLNRMVDIVLPESETARRFNEAIASMLPPNSASADDFRIIRRQLSDWKDNAAILKPILPDSYLLQELEPLANLVIESCDIAIQALDYLQFRRVPPDTWRENAARILKIIEEPHAEMFLDIAPGLKMLINAADAIR